MKNTIKMSLVAALAVAGLSTTASAGGLEEAIKGVSIKGKMEVEYDWEKDGSSNEWDYDFDVTAKVPVNDNVTAVLALEADHGGNVNDKVATADKGSGNDSNVDVTKLYFAYTNGAVSAMAGKMGMAGAPWYDDEKANGVVGIYNAGPVAIAAGHFTGSTGHLLTTNQDITAAALIAGNIADSGIGANLWYADITDVGSSFSLNVNGAIGPVSFDVRHTDVDFDDINGGSAELTKLVVSGDIEAFNIRAGYGTTNDNKDAIYIGTNLATAVNFEGVGGDNDAATTMGLEQLNIADYNDADVFLIGAGTTMGAFSINLDYIDGEAGSTDFDELLLDVEYKMSKNFTIDTFYSMAEEGSKETDTASIALEYKF